MIQFRFLVLAGLVYASAPALADQAVSGAGVALDGYTLRVGTTTVRLFGIDTPEMRADGHIQRGHLDDVLAAGETSCKIVGTDQHRQSVGVCGVAGGPDDLGRWLLENGDATVYRVFTIGTEYAEAYDAAERRARYKGLGIWKQSASSEKPWWLDYSLTILGGFVAGAAGLLAAWWTHRAASKANLKAALNGIGSELTTLETVLEKALDPSSSDMFVAKIIDELPRYMTRYYSHVAPITTFESDLLAAIDATYSGLQILHWTNSLALSVGKVAPRDTMERCLEQIRLTKGRVVTAFNEL